MFNSERLKRLRKEKGLSQLEMSEVLNMSQSDYSKYETNKVNLNFQLMQKLHDEFGVDPNEFIVTNTNTVNFESGSVNNGCGISESENSYHLSIPKEVMESFLKSQLLLDFINKIKK